MTVDSPPPRPFAGARPELAVRVVRAVRRWRAPSLSAYAPRSLLQLPQHLPKRASVPAIDSHGHLGRWLTRTGQWMEGDVGRLLAEMDEANIEAMVNLDGRWGRELEANLDRYDRAHPGRFHTFCHVDWRMLGDPRGPDRLAESLQRSVEAGARGLKVWKDLGLSVTARGRAVLPDDPMLAPVWAAAAAAGVPVLIHVADPLAFFVPADRHNERLEEVLRFPKVRHRGGVPAHHRLIDSLERLVASNPQTRFIAAHACFPENLARVGGMLERYSNFWVDIAAVASELGRQPRTARALIMRHPDRVVFGTDIFPMRPAARRVYFRLLETQDEAFSYSDEAIPPSGRWPVYGLDLPAGCLERVYRLNATELLGATTATPSGRERAGVP